MNAKAKIHDRRASSVPINSRVAVAIVDDPYSSNGEKIKVTRSLRDDVLAHLYARKDIDDAKFEAGRMYERFVEESQIGTVKAADPTKEPVDGGGIIVEPISDRQTMAVRQLSQAARVLGLRGDALVRQILVDRRKFKEIAPSLSERDVLYVRRRFFDCLEELAILWKFADRSRVKVD